MIHIQILVGSVTGTAEGIARTLAEVAPSRSHKVSINKNPKLDDLVRDPEEVLLVCTSNTGAGDLPNNLQPLYLGLTGEYPDIAGRRYGLVNLGDSSYVTFGEAGRQLGDALEDLGAQRIGPPLVLDASSGIEPNEEARLWMRDWLEQL